MTEMKGAKYLDRGGESLLMNSIKSSGSVTKT